MSCFKPIDQIVFEDGKGDCLRACVASLLGRPLLSVPNFTDDLDRDPGPRMLAWLKTIGLHALHMQWVNGEHLGGVYFWAGPEYVIASGVSPRNNADGTPRKHAVVARIDPAGAYGLEVVHDPHPSKACLVGPPNDLIVIFPIIHPQLSRWP